MPEDSASRPAQEYLQLRQRILELRDDFDKNWKELSEIRKLRLLEKCFAQLQLDAVNQDPETLYCLGDAHQTGSGTKRSEKEALLWFLRAAEAGHLRAMRRLASIYRGWERTKPDEAAKAIHWDRKAAELGDPSAMMMLGYAYRDGQSVAIDPQQALHWFRKSFDAGNRRAALQIGRLYFHDLKNPDEGLRWLNRGAEESDVGCQLELAFLNSEPRFGLHNLADAFKWYQVLAIDHKEPRAMLALARHYRDGVSVPQDTNLARQWAKRALGGAKASSYVQKQATELLREMSRELF
jgi:TPR repeat protein